MSDLNICEVNASENGNCSNMSAMVTAISSVPEECSPRVCSMIECGQYACNEVLTEHQKELLQWCVKNVEWKAICEKHFFRLILNYEKLERYCCNPFSKHKKRIPNPRFVLRTTFIKSLQWNECDNLIPGNKVCNNCMVELRKLVVKNPEYENDPEYFDETAQTVSSSEKTGLYIDQKSKENELISHIINVLLDNCMA